MNLLCLSVVALAGLPKFQVMEIETGLGVGYAVRLADVNNDGRTDILVLDSKRVLWYENPTWTPHVILEGETPPDNVCFAPFDVNGDGKLDLAIGAGWQVSKSYSHNLFWLEQRGPKDPWRLHKIGSWPYVHRMQWRNVVGDARPELVILPLFGEGKSPPEAQAKQVPIVAFEIPQNPANGRWREHVLSRELHVAHNFMFRRSPGGKEMVVASFEGLTAFHRDGDQWIGSLMVAGDQKSKPNRGCSEVAEGWRRDGARMIATIEPWHGHQVVVYTPTTAEKTWKRTVVDDDLRWGHAIVWADLDGDGNDELIAGIRDEKSPTAQRGVRLYSFLDGNAVAESRDRLDPGGVAVEDLTVGDLDGDGLPEIVAAGRQTHNVRVYWNLGK